MAEGQAAHKHRLELWTEREVREIPELVTLRCVFCETLFVYRRDERPSFTSALAEAEHEWMTITTPLSRFARWWSKL